MNITIFGSGHIGANLGKKWAPKGHHITFAARNTSDPKYKDLRSDNINIKNYHDAVDASDVLVIAVPFPAVRDTLRQAGNMRDKILVDCTNPLKGLPPEFPSAAQAIAAWSGSGRVVKAFNSTGSANLVDPRYGDQIIDTFICGDDAQAKDIVARLATEIGFSVIDAGDLSQAVLLESLAKLWIHLAYGQGMGAGIAFKVLKR